MPIEKIISGGQTGVDRAALDAAIELGIAHGGWCPLGRIAEDGVIDARYLLTETSSSTYAIRTEWNVRDADGTIIVNPGYLSGGTALTARMTGVYEKPCMLVDINKKANIESIREWLRDNDIRILNVAGPRESKVTGIYLKTRKLLADLLRDT